MSIKKSLVLTRREIMRLAVKVREDMDNSTHPATHAVQRDIERVAATGRLTGQDFARRPNTRP